MMLLSRALRAGHLSHYSAKGNWSHFSMRQRYPQMLKAQTDPTINDFFFELFLRKWFADGPSYNYAFVSIAAFGACIGILGRGVFFNPDVCGLSLGVAFKRTMDMTVTLPPLSEVLRNAGADSMVCEYMQARGLTAVGAFAKVANSIDNLKTTLVQPLLDGYTKGDLHLIIDEADKPIVEAVIITAWEEAQKLWIHHLRLPPWPGATPPAGPAAPAATASLADEKPSRQLPVGVWNSAIQRYNLVEIQGIPRRFPEKELLGAEVTLARMHHEHTKSKMYTPVGLGEIMTHRSFTPTREPGHVPQAGGQEASARSTQAVYILFALLQPPPPQLGLRLQGLLD
eukprot:g26194.t1